MVQSSSISITPSNHADRHRVGGADPLTGAVGIDLIRPSMRYIGVSDTIVHQNDTQQLIATNQLTYEKLKETNICKMGLSASTVRFTYLTVGNGSINCTYKLHINGVGVGTEYTDKGAQTRTEDISNVEDDDLIQVYGKRSTSGTWQCGVKYFRILGAVTQDAPLSNDP